MSVLSGGILSGAGTPGSLPISGGTITGNLVVNGNFSSPPQTLTPGTTVSWNMNLGNNAKLTPAQSFTLSNPTNLVAGSSGLLTITQDSTGSRVITWGSNYRFAGGTKFVLSTAASSVDEIAWYSPDGTHIDCNGLAAFA